MDSKTIFLLCFGAIVLVGYTISLLLRHNKYIVQRNYIKAEMNRVRSEREYKYWKRKLTKLKLRQIPIIGFFIGR